MKQYGFLQALYMSFYSRDFYRDVANNWGAGVVLYLFLLLAICWGILMFSVQPKINIAALQFANHVAPQLPVTVTIQKGVLSTPKNHPYVVQTPEKKETVVVIDTSGKYKDLKSANAAVLITKDTVHYSSGDNKVTSEKIPADLNVTIETATVKNGILKGIGWLWILIFPLMIVLSLVYRLIQSIFYAIFGTIFSALSGAGLAYSKILKLTMVAITPTIIISTAMEYFGLWFQHLGALFVIAIIYVVFAVRVNKN